MLNYMTFNNTRNTNFPLLQGRKKAPFFPLNRTITSYAGVHRLKKTEKGLLSISQPIGFIVKNDEHALQLKDELSNWLVTENWAPLQFDNEPGRRYTAVVQNTLDDFEKFVDQRSGTVQFVAKDELGDKRTETINTTNTTIQVTGQAETPWATQTTFGIDADQFVLEANNGLYVQLDYNFIQGDVLKIDYKYRKVTLNDELLMTPISLQTNWLPLTPGYMQMKASHETEISYSERHY
ncbi:distal tail protein Dit [Lentibacillus salicampi]|nr:distal tail protein Dit [Lentibacillus salicampi]